MGAPRRVKRHCKESYDPHSDQGQSAIYSARRPVSEKRTVAEASVHQWGLCCLSTLGVILMGRGTESAEWEVSYEQR